MASADEDITLALETLSIRSCQAGQDSEEQDSENHDDDDQPTGSRSLAKTCLLQSCECDGFHPQFPSQKASTSGKKSESDEMMMMMMNKEILKPVEHIDDLPARLFQKILTNLRIWEQRPCRLVSKRWNDQILNCTEYSEKSFILVNHERVAATKSRVAEILNEFDPIFQNVRMIRLHQLQIGGTCLSTGFAGNITHLDLFHCGPFTWPVFLDLLISCHALEGIRVRKCPFKWPYDAEEWRNKYIEWLGRISKCGNRFPDFKAVEFRVKDPHDVLYMLKLVSQHSSRLSKISFTCKTPPQGLKLNSGIEELDDMYETVVELYDTLVETVNKFAKNLDQFHSYLIDPLHPPRGCGGSNDRNGNNNFGSGGENNGGSRCDTANYLLGKEETTIMNQFCSNVLSRLEWNNLNLTSFCLYGGEITGDNIPKQTDILCNFIKSQGNLEKVILPRMRFSTPKEFEHLLLCISKNVECIRVPIFSRMPDCLSFEFHRLGEYYIEAHGTPDLQAIIPPGTILPNIKTFSFYSCSDWIWQTVKIMTIINSFPCLTELLIRDDGPHKCTRIGDSDVQNICRYLPNLKKLHMTNVDCVTDFGWTGIFEKECKSMNETETYVPSPGTKIGYSFSALKNLEYLFLSDLGFRVTNVSMIYGFVFQNLRFMTLEGYPKVTPWGVERLRSSNSVLKRWSVDFHDRNISLLVERLLSFPISKGPPPPSVESALNANNSRIDDDHDDDGEGLPCSSKT